MWDATLLVRHRGCPISDESAAIPDVQLRYLSKIYNESERRLIYIDGPDKPVDCFLKLLQTRSEVTYLETNIGDSNNQITMSVEYPAENPSIRQLIEQFSCYPIELVVVQDGGERWQIRGESDTDLRGLIETIKSHGNTVELLSRTAVRESETGTVPITPPTDLLTIKQSETLHTAFTLGYYSPNDGVTIEHIAEELGVHQTTAWEHLKKAENKLITNYCSLVY